MLFAVLAGSLAGGFVSGLSGFAFGLVALSFWVWALDPQLLAPMVVFGSLLAQCTSVGTAPRLFDWRLGTPFLIGGFLGVPLGVLSLGLVDARHFRVTVGAVLVLYAGYFLLNTKPRKPFTRGGRLGDGCAGLIGGIMGGFAGLTGPAPTLWCSLRGWEKTVQRSVFLTFNLTLHAIILATYAISGKLNARLGLLFLVMLPAVLVAAWAGTQLFSRISEPAFRQVVLLLLLLSGLTLLTAAWR